MAKIVRVLSPYTEDKGIAMLSVLGDDNKIYTWKHEVGSSKAEELKGAYDAYKAEHLDEIKALEEQSKASMESPAAYALKLKEELDKEVAAKRAAANSKVDPEVEKLIDDEAERRKADIDKIVATEPSLKPLGDEAKANSDATAEKAKNGEEIVEEDKPKHNFIKGLALGVGAAVLTGALFATGFHLGKNQNGSEETQIEQENTIGKGLRENPNTAVVEVQNITAEDVRNHAENVIALLNGPVEKGGRGLNINEEDIQGLIFEYNQEYLSSEELNTLIQDGFVPDDPNDMPSTVKAARAEIMRQNALSIVNADIDPIDMGIFVVPGVTGDKTRELTAAFTQDMYDLKAAVAVINDVNTTQAEKDEAKETILRIWTSFKAYGELTDYEIKTDLPYDFNNSTVPGQFSSLHYVQAYAEAARFAGVSQSERDYVSGDDIKNGETVFVDYSNMVNLTLRNYERACNGEYKPATR